VASDEWPVTEGHGLSLFFAAGHLLSAPTARVETPRTLHPEMLSHALLPTAN
jgi:hypothetical protein